jgi:hypothetical protein
VAERDVAQLVRQHHQPLAFGQVGEGVARHDDVAEHGVGAEPAADDAQLQRARRLHHGDEAVEAGAHALGALARRIRRPIGLQAHPLRALEHLHDVDAPGRRRGRREREQQQGYPQGTHGRLLSRAAARLASDQQERCQRRGFPRARARFRERNASKSRQGARCALRGDADRRGFSSQDDATRHP